MAAAVSNANQPFDDSLLDNDPLFFDIDEAFFDDFFNIEVEEEDSASTTEDSVESWSPVEELKNTKRKTPSNSSADNSSQPVNKKNKVEFVPEETSRIPKSDIRRTYPKLFTEVFNGQDLQETIKLLERIAVSDLVCTHRFVGGQNPTGPAAFDVQGIVAIATFWDTYQQAVPDCVFEILETKIRVSSTDRRSAILCKWVSKGTKVLSINGLTEGSEDKIVISSPPGKRPDIPTVDAYGNNVLKVEQTKINSKSPSKNSSTASTTTNSNNNNNKFGLGNMLNEKIFRVGTLTFQLNSTKKITRLDFVYSNNSSLINI